MTTLPVAEVFGPTWQGEGPFAGVRTGFVRLGRCNLSCEWCDTPYTWDETRYDVNAEAPDTPVDDVHVKLRQIDVRTVCLSGGEPLLHHKKLSALLVDEWSWHVETNGTIQPPRWWVERVTHTSVSPKVNTRDPLKKRIKIPALAAWGVLACQGRACFKFVASQPADLDVIQDLVDVLQLPSDVVWVMPEGTNPLPMITRHRRLAESIQDHGWNTTTRLHVLLYGTERGR